MRSLFHKIHSLVKIFWSALGNLVNSGEYDLFYVIENAPWSIAWDGKYITDNLNKLGLKSKTVIDHICLRNKIIHFGSENTYIYSKIGLRKVHPSNYVVLTWFHVSPDDSRVKYVPELNKKLDYVHTSCSLTRKKLIELGLDREKIIVIPLGVSLETFRPLEGEHRKKIRRELGISNGMTVIGSFQKDGVGWGTGLEPKMVKGPDVFCDVVEQLSKHHNICVLLTGPARGYVKKRLKQANIFYIHKYLENYLDVVKYYNAVDICLITSRAEGGPKALLEAMATGVPIVSTRVGMAPEVIRDLENGMLANIDDVDGLKKKVEMLIQDPALKEKIIRRASSDIVQYDWKTITRRYKKEIYSKFCA